MTINVKTEPGALFPVDLAFLLDFAAFGVEYTRIGDKSFEGTGTYFGLTVTVNGQGSGFNNDLTAGKLNKMTFDLLPGEDGGKITLSSIGLTMKQINRKIDQEINGNEFAIETFSMAQGWNATFDNSDQFAPPDLIEIDGLDFNLSGNDTIRLKGGQDVFYLGDGKDKGYGGGGADVLEGGRGADRLFGGKDGDDLYGQKGNDRLVGGAGRDDLFGNGGRDVLIGGKGRDDLRGGKGNDTFVFKTGDGKDTIRDFAENNNREDIDLSGVRAITNFRDLKRNHMEQDENNVIIDDGAGLEITVRNAQLSDMNRGDFIF